MGALFSLLLMSACGTATPTSEPTVDLNAIRTEVASTVIAQVTQAAPPTPTITPIPSFTPTFTLPVTTEAPATGMLTGTVSGDVSGVITGTLTAPTPTVNTNNKAAYVSQTIPDGTVFEPGETFTMTWTVKNVGTTTWTTAYLLRFFAGNTFGAAREYPLSREVAPNDTIEISIPMKAPTTAGDYRTDWVLSDVARSNFKEPVFLKITVAGTPTAAPTATRTPAGTATP
jgi:hypothetical protein